MLTCLSAVERDLLYTIVRIFGGVCLCFTGGFLVSVVYSTFRHSPILHELIISLFDGIYFSLFALGVLIFLIALVGWRINRNIALQPINESLGRCHLVWCLFLGLSLVSTFLCVYVMSRVVDNLAEEVEPRYRHGAALYMERQDWQQAVDRIQTSLECCGASSYTDWYSHSWIPLELLPADRTLYSKIVQPDGQVLVPLTPSSCCRTPSTTCGHRAWLESKDRSWDDIQPTDPQMLYTTGCVDAIIEIVGWDIRVFTYFLAAISILQVITLVCSRYLYTSTRNSLLLGRPKGKAVGWIIGSIIGGGAHKTLDEYDKDCGDEDVALVVKEREHFKCMSKIRKRCFKDPDSEAETSDVKTPLLKSPCLTKLRQKCKKKKDSELITDPETEAESEPETKSKNKKEVFPHVNGAKQSHNESVELHHSINERQPITKDGSQSKTTGVKHSDAEIIKQSQSGRKTSRTEIGNQSITTIENQLVAESVKQSQTGRNQSTKIGNESKSNFPNHSVAESIKQPQTGRNQSKTNIENQSKSTVANRSVAESVKQSQTGKNQSKTKVGNESKITLPNHSLAESVKQPQTGRYQSKIKIENQSKSTVANRSVAESVKQSKTRRNKSKTRIANQSKGTVANHSEPDSVKQLRPESPKQPHNKSASNSQSWVEKKTSKNLIDAEYEIVNEKAEALPFIPPKVPVLEMAAEQKTPFIIDESANKMNAVKLITESLLNSSFNRKVIPKTEYSGLADVSEVELENGRGFQETRKLFENASKGESRANREINIQKFPDYQMNLIDFGDSTTSTPQRQRGGESSPADTSRSEGEYPPVILRNYGPPSIF